MDNKYNRQRQEEKEAVAMIYLITTLLSLVFLGWCTFAHGYQASSSITNQAWANHEANKHRPQYKTRGAWARVLIAFGESVPEHNHLTPMKESECRPRENNWSGWTPFCDELKKIEAASTTVIIPPPPVIEEEQPQPVQEETLTPAIENNQNTEVTRSCEAKLSNESGSRLDYMTFKEGDYISFNLTLEVECLVTEADNSSIVIQGNFNDLDFFARNSTKFGSEHEGWFFTCEHVDFPDQCVLIASPDTDWDTHGSGYISDVRLKFADVDNNVVGLNRKGTIALRSSDAPPSESKYTIHNDSLHLRWKVENDDHNWFIMQPYYAPGGGANIKAFRPIEMPILGTPGYSGNARGYFKFKTQRHGPGWGSTENEIEDHEWWGWTEHDKAINPVSESPSSYHIAVLKDDYDCSLGWAKIRVWLEENPPNMYKKWFKFYNNRTQNYGHYAIFNNDVRICR